MRSKSYLMFFILFFVLGSFLIANPVPAKEKTWTLKLSIEVPEMAPLCKKGFKPWAEEVEKATNGRVKIQIYPSGTLCKVGDMLDAVESGLADLGWCWPGVHEGFASLAMVANIPLIYEKAVVGSQALWELYENTPAIQADFDDYKLVSMWTWDAYFFMSRKKPIRSVDDVKGMKVRAGLTMHADYLSNLGAVPVTMRMPDVYMALQKGTMDATLAEGQAVTAFKFYELVKSYTKPGMLGGGHILIMNKDVWESMPSDVQQQIMSVSGGTLSKRLGSEIFDTATKELPAYMDKKGVKYEMFRLSPEEVARFKAIGSDPVRDKWIKDREAEGQPAKQVLDTFEKLVRKYRAAN